MNVNTIPKWPPYREPWRLQSILKAAALVTAVGGAILVLCGAWLMTGNIAG